MPGVAGTTTIRTSATDRTSGGAATPARTLRVGLFGCALDTGNAGVSALGLSTTLGLLRARGEHGNIEFTIFDYGEGERRRTIELGEHRAEARLLGCYNSRRYWRPSNLMQMFAAARAGLGRAHPYTRRLRELDAILDISGGDSFSDIYGPRRFNDVTLPKEIAAALGVPLVLLPQTYGPYRSDSARARAARVTRSARQAWARDEHSHEVLRSLLGDAFDPSRHRSGVDVAFGLPALKPRDAETVERLAVLRQSQRIVVGLNVSGLLFNQPGEDRSRYGFRGSYRELIVALLNNLLAREGVGVLLVPHVAPRRPMADCDATACAALLESLTDAQRRRIVAPTRAAEWEAPELKWLIGQCGWFCGTRMHACIGAISQGVPTTAIAYSDKTLGVFRTAGVGDRVVDPRNESEAELLGGILRGFEEREETAAALARSLPELRTRLDEQFRVILEGVGP